MIVIIDNYDSFTYNLVQYFKQLTPDVIVFRNDKVTVEQLQTMKLDLIVLSPGPGNPSEAGISKIVVEHFHKTTPILGVCLGLQIITEFFGGEVVKGEQPMHGKVSQVTHDQQGIFTEIPTPTDVTRYHSLVAKSDSLPDELQVSSRSIDGAIMGIRHKQFPIEAIQFHPESILTSHGFTMIKNSYKQALAWKYKRGDRSEEALSSI